MVQPWGRDDSYHIRDGKVYYRSGERMEEVRGRTGNALNQKNIEKMQALIELRTLVRQLLDRQKTSCPDAELEPLREQLNQKYDAFREQYKEYLNAPAVRKLFGRDADYPVLVSLENHEAQSNTYTKADIFYQRTVNPVEEIKAVDTVEEAYQVSLDRRGKPDVPYMAVLLQGRYPDSELPEVMAKVQRELLDKGIVFVDPQKPLLPDDPFSQLTDRAEYLSGNVREKLFFAEEAAAQNPDLQRNVDALKPVIPEDIHAEEITVRMDRGGGLHGISAGIKRQG